MKQTKSKMLIMLHHKINIGTEMPNTPRLAIGTSDFRKMVIESDIFVDKSLLIQEILDTIDDAILITRPRRWGKSINLDMLKKFLALEVDESGNKVAYNCNGVLFRGGQAEGKILSPLKVATAGEIYMLQQGQYPVIKLDFKDVATIEEPMVIARHIRQQLLDISKQYKLFNSKSSINHKLKDFDSLIGEKQRSIDIITEQISSLTQRILQEDTSQSTLERQQVVLRDDRLVLERQQAALRDDRLVLERQQAALEKEFQDSIAAATRYIEDMAKSLCSELHSKYGRKVYVLIDEYDATINNNYNKLTFNDITGLIRGLFTSILKGNEDVQKGILTGILRVAKANLFSGLNNVREYGVLDSKFARHYGFTEEEVSTLLKARWSNEDGLSQRIEEARLWYNGYTMGEVVVYNPWSIAGYFSDGEAKPYWVESGSDRLLKEAIGNIQMHSQLINLRDGKSLKVELEKQVNFDDIKAQTPKAVLSLLIHAGYLTLEGREEEQYLIKLPNNEVKRVFSKLHREWVQSETSKLGASDQLLKEIHDALDDKSLFQEKVNKLILDKLSEGEKSEAYFQTLIGGIIEVYSFTHGSEAKHKVLVEKSVSKGGRIDNIFYPGAQDKITPVIIHEYKQLHKTTLENVKQELDGAFWQILDKKYLDEPLSKKKHHTDSHKWENIKLRSIVFVKDETSGRWSMHMEEKKVSIESAKKISEVFKESITLSNAKSVYGASDVYDLVEKIETQPPAKKAHVDDKAKDGVDIATIGGHGSIPCEELPIASFYSKYYGNGLDHILDLRLSEEGVKGVTRLKSSVLFNKVDSDLKEIEEVLSKSSASVVKPYNIDHRHWVGVAFLAKGDNVNVEYIDSESNVMPEILRKSVSRIFPSSTIVEKVIIPEVDNCCGAEVIEELVKSVGGKSMPTKTAVLHHMALVENSWIQEFKNTDLPTIEDRLSQDISIATNICDEASSKLIIKISDSSNSMGTDNPLSQLNQYLENILIRYFYDNLQSLLERFATKHEVTINKEKKGWEKEVYRELALKLHPDKGGTNEQFQELQNIYNKAVRSSNEIESAEVSMMYKKIEGTLIKANIGIKAIDTALDGIRLWQEQTINNVIKLGASATQLYGMITATPSITLGIGIVEAGIQIWNKDYIGAVQAAATIGGYTLAMVTFTTTLPAIATATSIGLTTYSAYSVFYKGYEMLPTTEDKIQPTEIHNDLTHETLFYDAI